MNPAMFVVLWKGSSCWGEWDRAFCELQHPDNVQSMNLHVFFKPLKNLKVETVKHLLLSAWFLLVVTMLISSCWEQSEGEALMRLTLMHPVGLMSAGDSKGPIQMWRLRVWWGNESVFLRQTSLKHLCVCYVFIFVCERKSFLSFAEVIKHEWHRFHLFPLRAARVSFCVVIYGFCLVVWP